MSAPTESALFQFTFDPLVVPQGDGSFLVKPGKPLVGRIGLTVAQAAKKASVSSDTILRLFDSGFLEGGRPSPRKTFIFEDSLEAHLKSTRDLEFWERRGPGKPSHLARYKAALCPEATSKRAKAK